MARVVKRKDRDPYKKGVQHRPPKAKKVTVKGKPGTPGAKALNPDQMLTYGDRQTGMNNELGDLNADVTAKSGMLPQELEDIQRMFTHAKDSQASDLSSRGIFQSSIRDLQLADLNSQQALQEQAANNVVEAAKRALFTRTQQIEGAGGERQRTNTWADQAKVQNAADATTPGTPDTTAVDRDPGKPGIQAHPPQPVSVNVQIGHQQQGGGKNKGRAHVRPRSPHGDPYARR